MPRFVILQHPMPVGSARGDHCDIMLEQPQGLATWAVEPAFNDRLQQGQSVVATRLADHRAAYLEYQGPVSGDRGHVTRWDAGEYRTIRCDETVWQIELQGGRITGTLTLTLQPAAQAGSDGVGDQRWLMSLLKI